MLGFLSLALLLVAGGGVWVSSLYGQLSDITRFELRIAEAPGAQSWTRPKKIKDEGAVTVLLVGVDNGTRSDLRPMLASGKWEHGAFRADTIIVVHLPSNRESAQVVSIPRDSWVPIAGHGTAKINAAFSWGGPSLLARTVEEVTDVRLDHVVVADWDGFRGITETLGGVQVAGTWLGPDQALDYVRERYSLPNGDFDRVERQRQYLLGVLHGLRREETRTPRAAARFLGDLSDLVSVDSELSNLRMVELFWSARHLRDWQVETVTAPHAGTGRARGQSIVRLDVPATHALFDRIVGPHG